MPLIYQHTHVKLWFINFINQSFNNQISQAVSTHIKPNFTKSYGFSLVMHSCIHLASKHNFYYQITQMFFCPKNPIIINLNHCIIILMTQSVTRNKALNILVQLVIFFLTSSRILKLPSISYISEPLLTLISQNLILCSIRAIDSRWYCSYLRRRDSFIFEVKWLTFESALILMTIFHLKFWQVPIALILLHKTMSMSTLLIIFRT